MIKKIPIEISARHIHLSKKDLEILFGKDYRLRKKRDLTQPHHFAAKETLALKTNGEKMEKVRIVGPLRKRTQVELSLTDAFNLGISLPIRKSGNLAGTPGVLLIGPKGKLKLKEGLIIPWRHIHLSFKKAKNLRVKDGDFISVKTKSQRFLTFHNVEIRVGDYRPCLHLDTDEGNAAGIIKKGFGELIL